MGERRRRRARGPARRRSAARFTRRTVIGARASRWHQCGRAPETAECSRGATRASAKRVRTSPAFEASDPETSCRAPRARPEGGSGNGDTRSALLPAARAAERAAKGAERAPAFGTTTCSSCGSTGRRRVRSRLTILPQGQATVELRSRCFLSMSVSCSSIQSAGLRAAMISRILLIRCSLSSGEAVRAA